MLCVRIIYQVRDIVLLGILIFVREDFCSIFYLINIFVPSLDCPDILYSLKLFHTELQHSVLNF